MKSIPTEIPEVIIIEPSCYSDERGYFLETFQAERYRKCGITATFVQDNLSRSKQGVLRGLHYQNPQSQGKLVYVTRGKVFDVAVDIRFGSPTFGKSVTTLLDDESHRQMYIPPGFAHGFCVLSDIADFHYKCTDYYNASYDRGIRWDCPTLAIPWPSITILVNNKDNDYPTLKALPQDHFPKYENNV